MTIATLVAVALATLTLDAFDLRGECAAAGEVRLARVL
jgi:hypothetical protein